MVLLCVRWEVRPPSSKVLKRSKEVDMKMQQIHQHNACFRKGIAGMIQFKRAGQYSLLKTPNSVLSIN